MKRVLLAAMAIAATLSAAPSQPEPAEDMNLTANQQEQIRRIQTAGDHCVNHAHARIDALLTPEQRRLLENHPGMKADLYQN